MGGSGGTEKIIGGTHACHAQQCWLDPSEVSMVDPSVADLPGLTGQTLGSIKVNDA
jgi:hypothetical protein